MTKRTAPAEGSLEQLAQIAGELLCNQFLSPPDVVDAKYGLLRALLRKCSPAQRAEPEEVAADVEETT